MSDSTDVRQVARDYLRQSWGTLEEQHVLPRPSHLPWVSVGTDYFGPDFESEARAEFEEALVAQFPGRLVNGSVGGQSPGLSDRSFEFTSGYVFSLLESAISYSTAMRPEEACERAIDELLSFLDSSQNETASHRIVSHLSVSKPLALGSGAVEIRPLEDTGWIDVHALTEMPGLKGESLFLFQRVPHAVVSARGSYSPSVEWSDQLQAPSALVGQAVLGLRLFRRTSARNIAEWSGFCEPGGFTRPLSKSWPYDTISAVALADAEDTAALGEVDAVQFDGFVDLLDETIKEAEADARERKLGASGWFSALSSFQESFGFDRWVDQVPRLIRSMEGALLPEASSEAVKSRLRQRLCLLLQTDEQSCNMLFYAVGHLYDLRSEVEHAADVKAAKQIRRLRSVSGSTEESDGISQQRAIEALRDLARKSIVVRVILASGPDPMWPIADVEPIDRRLVEDGFRSRCRERLAVAAQEFGPGLL